MTTVLKGVILLLFVCLSGCDSTPVDVQESLESDIYPLEVGNSWTYLFTAHENEVLDSVDTVFVEIIGTEVLEFQGRSLEVFQEKITRSSSRSEPLVLLLRHEKDGLYRYFKGNREYPLGDNNV